MTPEELALETAIHNEQTKLIANCLNIVAAGLVVTGIVGPLTTVGMRVAASATIDAAALALMGIWLIAALILNGLGALILRRLR